jgi:histidine triad (HIT) family protein
MSQICIFCQIVNEKIPAHRLYEDSDVLAFLDIQQVTVGHTIVIPKNHYEHFLSTPKLVMHQVMNVAQRIGQAQMQTLHAKGINLLSNVLPAAGQSVFHFHVHVIPRYLPSDRLKIEMLQGDHGMHLDLPVLAKQLKETLEKN